MRAFDEHLLLELQLEFACLHRNLRIMLENKILYYESSGLRELAK